MAYTQYFGSKPVSDWQANGPAESGHNFIDQINEQKGNISAAEGKYGEQQGMLNDARNTYQDLFKNQTGYSDLYGQAKTSEGVDDAKAQYQKSLASVNATQSAMNNLPSTINAGSNVVLNASQRNAALGNQMAKYQNTLDYWTRQNAGDLSEYQKALASAQDLAKSNMGQEQAKVATALNDYQSQMNQLNELYNQVIREREIMHSIYGKMYDDEYRHMQQEIEAWAQNLQAETERYAQDQATARNNATIAAQNYATDISKYLNSGYIWDGNEWTNQNEIKQPIMQSRISTTGNAWSPQTGAVSVEPVVTYRDNGKNGYNRVENYVASPEMLAQLMYGSN